MKLEYRQKQILEALIGEYVKTARAVSSDDLIIKYKFPLSSATIRNDFKTLDRLGYISQPHISAGRVPTDKAYRFYINERDKRNAWTAGKKSAHRLSELPQQNITDEEFLQNTGAALSKISHSFTATGFLEAHLFFKHGFAEIMDEPEFENQDMMRDLAEFIDGFEERMNDIFCSVSPRTPSVFIGKENPVKEAREYGMIVYAYEKNNKAGAKIPKRKVISILGPKRMNYERNIALLKEFDEMVHRDIRIKNHEARSRGQEV